MASNHSNPTIQRFGPRLALLQRLLPGPEGRAALGERNGRGGRLGGAVAEVQQVLHGHHLAGGGRGRRGGRIDELNKRMGKNLGKWNEFAHFHRIMVELYIDNYENYVHYPFQPDQNQSDSACHPVCLQHGSCIE